MNTTSKSAIEKLLSHERLVEIGTDEAQQVESDFDHFSIFSPFQLC